jgi:cell fate regulator YaaT (PSP1 superfamily)
MKLLYCEYTLDKQKLIIYFESEERVDFRQLVKDLAEEFRARIELRQVGSRDGAKVLGGLGPCGLIVCCNTFIEEFDNVSIKMAKNQNLSLNPQKISGTCGKLLCCIKYENETYAELRKNIPDINDIVTLEEGDGKVLSVDVLKRQVKVKMFEDEKFLTIDVADIKSFRSKKNRDNKDGKGTE